MINWETVLKFVDVVVGEVLFNNVVEKTEAVKTANENILLAMQAERDKMMSE